MSLLVPRDARIALAFSIRRAAINAENFLSKGAEARLWPPNVGCKIWRCSFRFRCMASLLRLDKAATS